MKAKNEDHFKKTHKKFSKKWRGNEAVQQYLDTWLENIAMDYYNAGYKQCGIDTLVHFGNKKITDR